MTLSRHLLPSTLRPQNSRPFAINLFRDPHNPHSSLARRSNVLSNSYSRRDGSTTAPTGKLIVLEQPDRFRPPSHPQRLNRRPPRNYPGPPLSDAERQAHRTRKYPHMFPNEGTGMYWFLTNKWVHMWISLGVLSLLAIITLTQSFLLTSPFAHLIPPVSTAPFHPFRYISEWLSVLRLHANYTSQQTADSRAHNILDAQKRRLYRRAHGMEDLDAEGDQGIDVRGLVPWDDGLTNKERKEGGRREVRTGRRRIEQGGGVGDALDGVDGSPVNGAVAVPQAPAEMEQRQYVRAEDEVPRKKKVKRWLGIWE